MTSAPSWIKKTGNSDSFRTANKTLVSCGVGRAGSRKDPVCVLYPSNGVIIPFDHEVTRGGSLAGERSGAHSTLLLEGHVERDLRIVENRICGKLGDRFTCCGRTGGLACDTSRWGGREGADM